MAHDSEFAVGIDSLGRDICSGGAGLKPMRWTLLGSRLPGPPIDLPHCKAAPLPQATWRTRGVAQIRRGNRFAKKMSWARRDFRPTCWARLTQWPLPCGRGFSRLVQMSIQEFFHRTIKVELVLLVAEAMAFVLFDHVFDANAPLF
jgi:hypothetical protein